MGRDATCSLPGREGGAEGPQQTAAELAAAAQHLAELMARMQEAGAPDSGDADGRPHPKLRLRTGGALRRHNFPVLRALQAACH